MKEPNLEAVLECLNDLGHAYKETEEKKDVLDAIFEKRKNVDADLQQILYFCRKERAATFENEISQIENREEKERVISSIISMYPITKNVVIEMLKKSDITPADYLEVIDFNGALLKKIKGVLDEITKNSITNSVNANRYSQKLEEIEAKIASLNLERDNIVKNISNYREKIDEKVNLEKEINEIRNLTKSGELDAKIAELTAEKSSLEKQKKDKEEEKKRLVKEIDNLKEYLPDEDKCENEEYSEALKALESCIKAMANGR